MRERRRCVGCVRGGLLLALGWAALDGCAAGPATPTAPSPLVGRATAPPAPAAPRADPDPRVGLWVLAEPDTRRSATLAVARDAASGYRIQLADGSVQSPRPEADGTLFFQPSSLSAAPWVRYRYDPAADQLLVSSAEAADRPARYRRSR